MKSKAEIPVPGPFSASLCSKGIALGLVSPVPGSSITCAGGPASPTLFLTTAEHCSQHKTFSPCRVWVLRLTRGARFRAHSGFGGAETRM